MVTHDAARRARIHHAPYERDGCDLRGTTIDQISNKDRDTPRRTPSAIALAIAKVSQEFDELVVVTVDVTDNVIACRQFVPTLVAMSLDNPPFSAGSEVE